MDATHVVEVRGQFSRLLSIHGGVASLVTILLSRSSPNNQLLLKVFHGPDGAVVGGLVVQYTQTVERGGHVGVIGTHET